MNSRNYGCRITKDVKIKNNDVVIMENELLRITILVSSGSDIIELLYKPKDIDFMWRSPVRLHERAKYISTTGDSFGNYLDHNSGGWQEILPNGGKECNYKGACLGMHGEISNVPWEYEVIKDEKEEIILRLSISTIRSPFRLVKDIILKTNTPSIYIKEKLTNFAKEDMDLMWGHHPTIGQPFLDSSCCIRTNALKAFTQEQKDFTNQRLETGQNFSWPKGKSVDGKELDMSLIPIKTNNTADMIYLKDFPKEAEYEIYNADYKVGFNLKWDGEKFPYAWIWLVCGGADGYPWYGRTYNLAIEPWTSYPSGGLLQAIKMGSSLKMKKDETIHSELYITIKDEEIACYG